ncbi:MAG: hypothetical protein J5793_01425 [Clostridia bacterium]|nr:hypothetical protein [Clostridia bacterium]
MVNLYSDYSVEELCSRWDDRTAPARFAGNDDALDLVFSATRRGCRVKLIRRPVDAREPFAAVFRGKIKKAENGSVITGFFTKGVGDYVFSALCTALSFAVFRSAQIREAGVNQASMLLTACIVAAIILLYNRRSVKRQYTDFMSDITGKDPKLFLTRRERKADEEKEKEGRHDNKRA